MCSEDYMDKPFQEAQFYRTFIVEPHPWIVSNTWMIEAGAETFAKLSILVEWYTQTTARIIRISVRSQIMPLKYYKG